MKFRDRIAGIWVTFTFLGIVLFIYTQNGLHHVQEKSINTDLPHPSLDLHQQHLVMLRKKLVKSDFNSNYTSERLRRKNIVNANTIKGTHIEDKDVVDELRYEEPEDLETTESPTTTTRSPVPLPPKHRYRFPKHLKPTIVKHQNYKHYSDDLSELDLEDDTTLSAIREEIKRRAPRLRLYTSPPE